MLSPIDLVLSESDYLKLDQGDDCPQFGPEYDVIFDFGGYLDKRVISAIKQADFVMCQ